ncbi:MAG: hypothetical protein KAJ23_17285 [Maribacter sp.]|nr:hypothetical protein [Maribacter sp.]
MRTESTLSVIFFTRKKRNDPEQLDIYIRITVNQKRAEISLKRDIPATEWDSTKGRGRGTAPNIQRLNGYLEQVYGEIFNSYKQLHLERKIITTKAIKLRYLGEDEQRKTLMELVEYHNVTMHTTPRPGTMKNYYSTKKYITKFIKEKKKVNDICRSYS